MATIYIDLTDDEQCWNGEISLRLRDKDSLTGANMAMAIGCHEIIMTVNQAITLYDLLDEWLNGKPVLEKGAIRGRVIRAIKEMLADHKADKGRPAVEFLSRDGIAHELEEYLRIHGIRYRLSGDPEPDEETAARRRRVAAEVLKTRRANRDREGA